MPQRLIFPAAATPAIKPVDAAFRRRDALSQVRGPSAPRRSARARFGGFQVEFGATIHGFGLLDGLKSNLIVDNKANHQGNAKSEHRSFLTGRLNSSA